ncbi:MAG: alpha-2-macroglobulin family protein [Deferribacteres bacterium]|nr:alpha-2-macroglobulin family protein [candidate division KSB1 bacterium]MCB9500608.1 alpha-2-macroglobulin family protein [Deferribacteres bacterium]
MRSNHFIAELTLLLIAIAFFSCSKDKKQDDTGTEITYTIETAKMVSHATSGLINTSDKIKIRFIAPMVTQEQTGQNLQKSVFHFEPEIEGVAQWEDNQTLVFIPDHPLPSRSDYSGVLDMAALFPQHASQKLETFPLAFKVGGRELQSIQGEFEPATANDPHLVKFSGAVSFTAPTSLAGVKKALSFSSPNESPLIEMQTSGSDSTRFLFSTRLLRRTNRTQTFTLLLKKDPLELSQDVKQFYDLSAEKTMQALRLAGQGDNTSQAVVLYFSDQLDLQQDITGLVSVTPEIPIKTKMLADKIVISGDFSLGESYTFTASPGIRSKWGTKTLHQYRQDWRFFDLAPQLEFGSAGLYLPSSNNFKLHFRTLNIQTVYLEIKRVFENNLGQFLQTERLRSGKTNRSRFQDYYVNRVGVNVASDTLQIDGSRNEWMENELDLSGLLQGHERDLLLVNLRYPKDGVVPDLAFDNSYRFQYNQSQIFKPLILCDFGLTQKITGDGWLVFATDLQTAKPLSGVEVKIYSYQNQIVASKITDSEGKSAFKKNDDMSYTVAEKSGQRCIITQEDMAWNLSTFDTEGAAVWDLGLKAFIYTERGVYRPGDDINISVIARNQEDTFPDNHPVSIKIFNPRNQEVFQQTLREGRNGFYNFAFSTSENDPTGNWYANISIGSRVFYTTLKIETVVPEKLKIELLSATEKLSPKDPTLNLSLISTYLFGNPAANLNAQVNLTFRHVPKKFTAFAAYSFENETIDFRESQRELFKGKFDPAGRAEINWKLPKLESIPSGLLATIQATVFEKGGRPNRKSLSIPVEPWSYFVGLLKPQTPYRTQRTGEEITIPVVCVDAKGDIAPGKPLTWRIYKGIPHWWWEWERNAEMRLRFKKAVNTELLTTGSIVSGITPVSFRFTPEENATYLIEVQDGDEDGHTAAFFVHASAWGYGDAEDAGMLALRSDREKYTPGDAARITFPCAEQGSVLLSIEKGSEILRTQWFDAAPENGEMSLDIPIEMNFTPTVYATVSLIQPHAQTANDRPLRMYGTVPLNVENAATRHALDILMASELESGKPFDVEVMAKDHRQKQFTIAVVDEGLLSLTNFKTPDPWEYFYRKLSLGVSTYDVFSHVLGANKGDIFKTFSIGGDFDAAASDLPTSDSGKRRFNPVSLFQGPLLTDKNGYAKVSFTMPEYVGAVRVMVVSAMDNSYSQAEKSVPVTKDLMIITSLPRVLGPAEKFSVPVTLFAMKDNIGKVDVTLKTSGPLRLTSAQKQSFVFDKAGEKDIFFDVAVDSAVGDAQIILKAKSQKDESRHETNVVVRPSAPRIFASQTKDIAPGSSVSLPVPAIGIKGSNRAQLTISRRPQMNISSRLRWLIRYPYGCIEQTTSAAFPQLYLSEFLSEKQSAAANKRQIDDNINAAIERIRYFQTGEGGFAYWPGGQEANKWGTVYAGHFLTEARKRGYHLPEDLVNRWMRYMKTHISRSRDKQNYHDQSLFSVYRLYVLALAGEPEIGDMNRIRENGISKLSETAKWMLAATYALAGIEKTATSIMSEANLTVDDYFEFGGTYGSSARDKAIILQSLISLKKWPEANQLSKEIAEYLSGDQWHSTQTLAWMLVTMGKYFDALEGENQGEPLLAGEIRLVNGEKIPFETDKIAFETGLEDSFDQNIEIFLDKRTTTQRAFATLSYSGVPLSGPQTGESNKIKIDMEWLDEDGTRFNPATVVQGKSFWLHVHVTKVDYGQSMEEVALVQILPSGWEIENTRLSNEDRPEWMKKYNAGMEEYLDLRDDRAMWFFDLNHWNRELDFVLKINAVTPGEFTLPVTKAEAMYNRDYRAIVPGMRVVVEKR